jgi:sarcosine oxidase subunit gamma
VADTRSIGPEAFASAESGHYGASATGLSIAEATIATAWNVQGGASRSGFVDLARGLFGVDLPTGVNSTARSESLAALWLGPASWLLVAGGSSTLTNFAAKRDALNEQGGALFDVTASRVAWELAGPRAADVLAKACPLDLHPRAFPTGACAQSVYGHVNVLVEKRSDEPAFTLLVARSFSSDVHRSIGAAAMQYGFDALAARPYR